MNKEIKDLIETYKRVVRVVDADAKDREDGRAYGGYIREVKGQLQEYLTEEIIKLAWKSIGGSPDRLEINSSKIRIPIVMKYVHNIKDKCIREYILARIDDYYYGLSVDKQAFIDGEFVLGIECKAYAENAMLKRILVDFHLLKTAFPKISCYLFQLESQLGGDYSAQTLPVYGSRPTHSIMSYFDDVDLHIFTFLEGERKIEQPIHKFFKPLKKEIVEKAIALLTDDLKRYL